MRYNAFMYKYMYLYTLQLGLSIKWLLKGLLSYFKGRDLDMFLDSLKYELSVELIWRVAQ